MSTTRSIRAWRLMAATVPTRWPVPRPDAGHFSAAASGSRGVAIGCSCRGDLLCRPAELAAVAQHAMENDRKLAGYGDGGLPGADPPCQARPPGLQHRPARDPMEDDPSRLVQVGAQQLVAAARDVAGVIRLAGLITPRRQADVGLDAGRLGEALRRIHDADVGERDQDTDTGCGHQPPHRLVLPGHGHEPAAEHRNLLANGLPGRQQRPSHLLQRPARDQRPHPLGEGPPTTGFTHEVPKVERYACVSNYKSSSALSGAAIPNRGALLPSGLSYQSDLMREPWVQPRYPRGAPKHQTEQRWRAAAAIPRPV